MDTGQWNSLDQFAIDQFPSGILIFNSDGLLYSINQFARAVLEGLGNPDLIASWNDFLMFTNLTALSESGQLAENQLVITDKTYVFSSQGFSWKQETIRIAYITDKTEEKRNLKDIHKKTSAILTGIRTRVTGIQGALSLIVDYSLPPEESAMLLWDCCYDIWLLSRYSDNLKDLSLTQANVFADALIMRPASLSDLVREAVENTKIFRTYHTDTTPIAIDVAPAIMVNCDRGCLVKVIESLVLNSLIYGGETNKIDIVAVAEEHRVVLTVSDCGIGIPIEDQEHIFEYRFRGRNKDKVKFNGMGIELFLAKPAIEAQEGALSFLSMEGSGTSFEIALNRASP
jgi:K+-sensing histidine kinase KdpD